MPATPENPFSQPREARSVTVTFRMTPTEHGAVKAIADREGAEIVDLIREGLGHVIEQRQTSAPPPPARARRNRSLP